VVPGAFHDESHLDRDISGRNALVATDFFYFGSAAIPVDPKFVPLLATTRGHKNTLELKAIERFWKWVEQRAPKSGRIAVPFEFTDEACGVQCCELEDDDIEEA
jgi:hypothetical protein